MLGFICAERVRGLAGQQRAYKTAGVLEAVRCFGDGGQRILALLQARRFADDVQPVRDQRVFKLQHSFDEPGDSCGAAASQGGSAVARSIAAIILICRQENQPLRGLITIL